MFDNLSERLERSFKILKGEGRITEINIAETVKDIRKALLEADVNYKTAKQFTDQVKEKALGQMGGQISADGGGGGMNPVGMMMGMGMAAGMGNQMAGMMSNGMNAMNQAIHQPTAPQMTPPPVPGTVSYMLAINGQQYGPYAMHQLQQMVVAGQVTPQTLVWCQGMAAWEPASGRPDLAVLFATATPPTPPTPPVPQMPEEGKS